MTTTHTTAQQRPTKSESLLEMSAAFWIAFSFVVAFLAVAPIAPALADGMTQGRDEFALDGADEVAMTRSEMDVNRGAAAENTLMSNQSLASTTSGNSVSVGGDLTTGTVLVGSDFANGGLGSYVFNTGNNSTINSAVSVNVQVSSVQ